MANSTLRQAAPQVKPMDLPKELSEEEMSTVEAARRSVARAIAQPSSKFDARKAAELAHHNMIIGNEIISGRQLDLRSAAGVINKDLKMAGMDLERKGEAVGKRIGTATEAQLRVILAKGLEYTGLNFDRVEEASKAVTAPVNLAVTSVTKTALEPIGLRGDFVLKGSVSGMNPRASATMTLSRVYKDGVSPSSVVFEADEKGQLTITAKKGPLRLGGDVVGSEPGVRGEYSTRLATFYFRTGKEKKEIGLAAKF